MKKILFIGQAPPKTIVDLPFGRSILYKWFESVGLYYKKEKDFELRHNQEGRFYLNSEETRLIASVPAVPVAQVKFGALINFFPGTNKSGGHLAPMPKQIKDSRPDLRELIINFSPDIVVPIGKISIEECLGNNNEETRLIASVPINKLNDIIGKEILCDPYNLLGKKIAVIPLPHPSGASTWIYQRGNDKLLRDALMRLKESIVE